MHVFRRPRAWRVNLTTMGFTLAAGALAPAQADQITFWNQEIETLEAMSPAPTPMASGRDLSMLNVGMYDAVNAALGSPDKSFYPTGPVAPGSSAAAAADAAAYAYLTQRFPTLTAPVTAAYNSQIAMLPSNAATANGITLGQNQAATVAAARTGDGSSAPSTYVPGTGPGKWQPTPPLHLPYGTANWATVTPFTMSAPSEFRPGPPPALSSPAYAAALAQLQSIGAANSTTRTHDQTVAAEFWDADNGVPLTWNHIALQVEATRHDSLLHNAQTFALLSTAQTDSFIATYDSKTFYSFWRPVTAITATTDPSWVPLLAAPPFPSYAANHASVPATGAAILDAMFGTDSAAFSLTFDTDHSSAALLGNPTFGDVTRSYTSFEEAAFETGMSRLWGGIHWPFDLDAGFTLGDEVAENALDEFTPVPEPSSLLILGIGIAFVTVLHPWRKRRQPR
jgi:hypothetical protein